MSTPAAC